MATTPTNNLSRLFQTAGTAKPQQGTGYTNLNRLFEANKQNQLGQKVAGDLGGQIGGVQTQLQQQQKQFAEESEKNKVGGQKDVEQRDAVLGRFSSASGAGDQVTEDETKAFGRFTAGQYGGPESLKDTSGLRQTAQQLQGQVSNFSPSGTQELLRQSVGGNRYTQGQSRLDSLLMDRSKLTPVARQAQGLGQEIQRADLAASGQAELNKSEAQRFAEETKSRLKGALGGLDTEAEQQLKAAQDKENARIAQIDNLQRILKGDQIQKLDPQGNPVLDDNGNPVYETKLTGTTDPYARIDEISKLMKEQGLVNQNQLEALFGKGTFGENKSTYDQQLADIRKNELNKALESGTGANLYNLMQATNGNFTNDNYIKGVGTGRANTVAKDLYTKAKNYVAANKLDAKDPNSYNVALGNLFKRGDITEENLTQLAPSYHANYGSTDRSSSRWDPYSLGNFGNTAAGNASRASSLEDFKNATGIAGRSTLDSRQDDFYKNLAASLGQNSQAAQNLTKEAVAGAPIRSNYAALSKLMGSQDVNPYSGEAGYKAGTAGLDAAQIRRALGY